LSPTWHWAGANFGVSLSKTFKKLLWPFLAPSIAVSIFICILFGAAEVPSVVLLRPPGSDSYVVRIFTVMANAPEGLVAAMCFALLISVGAILGSIGFMVRKQI
jgi:ABC-type Fe3+ transport system permease subunit